MNTTFSIFRQNARQIILITVKVIAIQKIKKKRKTLTAFNQIWNNFIIFNSSKWQIFISKTHWNHSLLNFCKNIDKTVVNQNVNRFNLLSVESSYSFLIENFTKNSLCSSFIVVSLMVSSLYLERSRHSYLLLVFVAFIVCCHWLLYYGSRLIWNIWSIFAIIKICQYEFRMNFFFLLDRHKLI